MKSDRFNYSPSNYFRRRHSSHPARWVRQCHNINSIIVVATFMIMSILGDHLQQSVVRAVDRCCITVVVMKVVVVCVVVVIAYGKRNHGTEKEDKSQITINYYS